MPVHRRLILVAATPLVASTCVVRGPALAQVSGAAEAITRGALPTSIEALADGSMLSGD